MLSAGLLKGFSMHFGLPISPDGFDECFKVASLQTAIGAGVHGVFSGKFDVGSNLLQLTASTIGMHCAGQIGQLYGNQDIDFITHKILHSASGAVAGALLSGKSNPGQGALAGAMGAFVAETFVDFFRPEKPEFQKLINQASEKNLTLEEFNAYYVNCLSVYNENVSNIRDFARMTTAVTALLLNQDVNIADFTGVNAVDHNFLILAYAGVVAASTAYSAYCIYDAYQKEGAIGALQQLGIELTFFAVGDVLVKVSGPALSLIIKKAISKIPGLETVLGSLTTKITAQVEAFLATHAGKRLDQVVSSIEAPIARGLEKVSLNLGQTSLGKGLHKAEQKSTSWAEKKFGKINEKTSAECLAAVGKKPIKDMSTEEFAQSLADRAEKYFGKGLGPDLGKAKHKYAEELGKKYQQMTGDKIHLQFEQKYKNGRKWQPKDGLKDHVRPDIYDPHTNKVFDHKFGNAKLEQPQINNYQQQMLVREGQQVTTQQVKPKL